ncbi:MAG: hypothetical protein K6C07_09610 [Bacteroidales bacterium]|nr:hypothetical protein [Bacteroidales bacterium]
MSSTYSLWFIPLCLTVGTAYAFLLYGNKHGYAYPVKVKRLLFIIRMLAVSLLCFLLLRPVVDGRSKEVEKPVLLFGIDNSESIVLTKDSAYYRTEYPKQLHWLTERLSRDYDVDCYLIGDSVRRGDTPDFTEKATNLARFFSQMEQRYLNRNVGAIICLSDGICTEGEDPLYTAKRLKYPIYTVALGDTSEVCDLRIAKTRCSRNVHLHNFFPIEILVQANRLKGKQTHLQVLKKGQVIFEKELSVNRNDYSEWVRLNTEATETGYLHYRIRLSEVEGEYTIANNTTDVIVKVLDEKHKVAIIYRAPHPDVAAISEAVKENPLYEVESFSVENFKAGAQPYAMYILHQLPTASQPMEQVLQNAAKNGAGLLFFPGDLSGGTVRLPAGCGLQLGRDKELQNDAYAVLNPDFADFTLSNDFVRMLPDFPPLQLPFGNYKLSSSASVCLYQKINRISTRYPLFFLNEGPQGKTAVFLGEGWWRWRIHNYLHEGNHLAFDHLIGQVFQFLVTREDQSLFRVKGKEVYGENEEIRLDAEVYDRNYALNNRPEVRLELQSLTDNSKHEYLFSRTLQAYQTNLGRLPEGEYKWSASVDWQGTTMRRTGHFYVQAVRTEAVSLTADHQLLLNLSSINGGEMMAPASLRNLEKKLRSNEQIKPLAHYSKRSHPLLDHIGAWVILILLLGGEWFLRKWSGNY